MLARDTFRDVLSRSHFLPTIAVLVGILVVVLMIGYQIRTRFRENLSENAADPEAMLVLYEEMRRQGKLSDSEFRSIKNQILPSRSHNADSGTDD